MNFIIRLLVNGLAILITSYLIPGIHLESPAWAIMIAVVLIVLNTILKPIMIILTLPFTIVTFGLFLLVINAVVILIAGRIIPGFSVDSFWSALGFSTVLSIIQSILEATASREQN